MLGAARQDPPRGSRPLRAVTASLRRLPKGAREVRLQVYIVSRLPITDENRLFADRPGRGQVSFQRIRGVGFVLRSLASR